MKFTFKSLCFILVFSFSLPLKAQKKCGWDQFYQQNKGKENFASLLNQLEEMSKKGNFHKSGATYTIPTVVHILYKDSLENLSKAQIQSQLDVLNQDFRKLNADTTNVLAGFSKADSRIEFCLAQRDPDGNTTNGITRTFTTIDNVCNMNSNQYYQLAPIWDADHYLNIWVCDIDDVTAGYAFPPGMVSKNKDGVVIDYSNFGTIGTAEAPYDKGRSTTHEIGHWLNLQHLWGNGIDNSGCGNDDGVSDTPLQNMPVYGCPSTRSSCSSIDMLSNFMQFINDACLGNFTEGQKSRMHSSLLNGRASLVDSEGCLPVGIPENELATSYQIYPNPAKNYLTIESIEKKQNHLQVQLYDLHGKEISVKTNQQDFGYEIMLSSVKPGIYFLRLSTSEKFLLKKLIIQK